MGLADEVCRDLARLEDWQLRAVSELVSEFLYERDEQEAEQEPEAVAGAVAVEGGKGPSGWIEYKYISRGGKRWGPYEYLRWREGGRLRSKYLGKVREAEPS